MRTLTPTRRAPATFAVETGDSVERWRVRDEAYGRMLDATAAGDDEAYERARRDFWRTGQ